MALAHLHVESGQETLLAVVAGALLASVAGLAANQVESRIRRREREQAAALLFGEVVASLRLILELARRSRLRGDPYGPATMRLIQAADREARTYGRNRESLVDLRDPILRARLHALFVRFDIALSGVLQSNAEVEALELAGAAAGDAAAQRLAARTMDRAQAFAFAVDLIDETPPILDQLRGIAGYGFEEIEAIARREIGVMADQEAQATARSAASRSR